MNKLFNTFILLSSLYCQYSACNLTSSAYSGKNINYYIKNISIIDDTDTNTYNISANFFEIKIKCTYEKLKCRENKIFISTNKSDCLVSKLAYYGIIPYIFYNKTKDEIEIQINTDNIKIILYPLT